LILRKLVTYSRVTDQFPQDQLGAERNGADGDVPGCRCGKLALVDEQHVEGDLEKVLLTEAEIKGRLKELAAQIEADYQDRDLLLVGVLKGAVMMMADLARSFQKHVAMDWMAVSSYGSGTKSSGVVRILKDLDTDISGKHVLVVEDIIDTGLTLSWLTSNLWSRGPASVEICALLRKPDAAKALVEAKYVGFDIPNEFVVGYGLDYAEHYRNLRVIATLAPHVYSSG
jgi:hypoxanthine phosphoribosyltransferase